MKHSAVLLCTLLAIATVHSTCVVDTTSSPNLGTTYVVSGEYLGQSFTVPDMGGASGTLDKVKKKYSFDNNF